MPKRTNSFQEAITFVATQLAPLGVTVKDSEELPELELDGVTREVDTLLEGTIGSRIIRLAIESRDRTRKDDIEWIDCLIGKYSSLPVDAILAISNSGFSAAAKAKAARHRIFVLTPEEIVSIDWPTRFQRIGVAMLEVNFEFETIEFETAPPFIGTPTGDEALVYVDDTGGISKGTIREFAGEVLPQLIQMKRSAITEKIFSLCKTLQDLQNLAAIEDSLVVRNISIHSNDQVYDVLKISYGFRLKPSIDKSIVRHRIIGDQGLLSDTTLEDVSILIAQTEHSKHGKVFVRPKRKSKKEN